jgi:hypothetical protein
MANLRPLQAIPRVSFEDLALVCDELRASIDQRGFLQSQIIERKRDIWSANPNDSVTIRDRQANYGTADLASELAKCESDIECLRIERDFLEFIIMGRDQLRGRIQAS